MAIKLLPATIDDAAAMIDAGMAAFANDALVNAEDSLASATPEQLADYKRWRIELAKARMAGPGKHYTKAIDDSNGMFVGFVGLYGPQAEAPDPNSLPRPAHMSHEISNELRSKMKAVKEKHIGQRNDVWYVQSMVVHPNYQGQGIATKLLQQGLAGADEAGQDVYLESTPTGKQLYQRCGFEEIDQIYMEIVDYTMLAMIRHPRTKHT